MSFLLAQFSRRSAQTLLITRCAAIHTLQKPLMLGYQPQLQQQQSLLFNPQLRAFSTATTEVEIDSSEPVAEINPIKRSNKTRVAQLRERYPGLKADAIPQRLLNKSDAELLKLETEVKDKFGFQLEEIRFIMRHKPTFIFDAHKEGKTGIIALQKYFVEHLGFDMDLVRGLVIKYPYILSKTSDEIESVFKLLDEVGHIKKFDALQLIYECPKLLSTDLETQMKECFFLFELYHKINKDQVIHIFRNWPYLFCCDMKKMRLFLAEFRKYRFTKKQIMNISKNSGGLLACKVSNLRGFFDYLKIQHNISATNAREILRTYPEFVLQNRRDLLTKKINLILKNSPNRTDCYIRNLIKRHPDLLLKSYASMEAKINYVKRNLNRQLHKERCFPLMLHLSYTDHIWPRCELLLQSGNKHFDLEAALAGSDKDFCAKFGLDLEQLQAKRDSRKQVDEKDKLWVYVAGI